MSTESWENKQSEFRGLPPDQIENWADSLSADERAEQFFTSETFDILVAQMEKKLTHTYVHCKDLITFSREPSLFDFNHVLKKITKETPSLSQQLYANEHVGKTIMEEPMNDKVQHRVLTMLLYDGDLIDAMYNLDTSWEWEKHIATLGSLLVGGE